MASWTCLALVLSLFLGLTQATCVNSDQSSRDAVKNQYNCDSLADLLNGAPTLPSYISANPAVFIYYNTSSNCGGSAALIQVYTNGSCIKSTSGPTQISVTCSTNHSLVTKYNGNSADTSNCGKTGAGNGATYTKYAANQCQFSTSTSSFVYLCPPSFSSSCPSGQYLNEFTLQCTSQTTYTNTTGIFTAPVVPKADISLTRNCDIVYNNEVRTGFGFTSQASGLQYCCKVRGILQDNLCVTYGCSGNTFVDNFVYGLADSVADGQYCYSDCNELGPLNITIEDQVKFNGPTYTGVQTFNVATSSPLNITSVFMIINSTSSHEVGYRIVPTINPDANGNSAYGCRFKGVYSVQNSIATCTILGGCGSSGIVARNTAGFLYDTTTNLCYSDCQSSGSQLGIASFQGRRRSVLDLLDKANLDQKMFAFQDD